MTRRTYLTVETFLVLLWMASHYTLTLPYRNALPVATYSILPYVVVLENLASIGLLCLIAKGGNTSLSELGFSRCKAWQTAVYGILIFLVTSLTGPLLLHSSIFHYFSFENLRSIGLNRLVERAMSGVASVVFAELAFYGYLITRLNELFGKVAVAVIVAAVVHALAFSYPVWYGSLSYALIAFSIEGIVALISGIIFVKTNSLVPLIVGGAAYHLSSSYMLLAMTHGR